MNTGTVITVHLSGEKIVAWITVVTFAVGAIAFASNAVDRLSKHQVVLEDHETRLDKIERDQTTNEKLTKLKESVDFLGWQVDAMKKELERRKR